MLLRYGLSHLIFLLCLAPCSRGWASTTTIALSGTPAVGIPTAEWETLDLGTLNSSGAIAFTGRLKHEGGSITAANDAGVWLFEGSGGSLLAQSGAGNVPGVGGADFSLFDQAALSDTGELSVVGDLALGVGGVTTANRRGLWRFNSLGDSLVVRTGSGDVEGVPNANFATLSNAVGPKFFTQSNGGETVISASLESGVGGVLSTNDVGIWSYGANSAALVAREGSLGVPNISGANFNEIALPAVNSSNQLAFIASLKSGSGGVGAGNATGIWRYAGSSGELLARTGSGDVPGDVGANFSSFAPPLLNDSGLVAVQAGLAGGGEGVWLYSDVSEMLLARTGNGGVPGVPSASFEELTAASINDSGRVLISAGLEEGPGGVSSADNQGLWLLNGGQGLIARTGSGNVPSVSGANFVSFAASALNEQGQVAFAAALEIGTGGVDASSDSGIWVVDPSGDAVLVAREGQMLAGRTIAALDFVSDSISQSDAFNDLGQLVFHATFTDESNGLFLYQPLRADFDMDGFVGGTDLGMWQGAYATTVAANADGDSDSDGADFLIWQREFGSGTPPLSSSVAVPEPKGLLLVICGVLAINLWTFCPRR